MVTEKIPAKRLDVIERFKHTINSAWFWTGAIIYSGILWMLVNWLDSLAVFNNWMTPVLYLCLSIMIYVSLITLLRVLLKKR
jgi:apolipoprotein N-acyltransferase